MGWITHLIKSGKRNKLINSSNIIIWVMGLIKMDIKVISKLSIPIMMPNYKSIFLIMEYAHQIQTIGSIIGWVTLRFHFCLEANQDLTQSFLKLILKKHIKKKNFIENLVYLLLNQHLHQDRNWMNFRKSFA